VKLLLDTHAFLWMMWGHNLSAGAIAAILDADNTLYLSIASYWEICIKKSIGKLDLTSDWIERFDHEISLNQIQWLLIEQQHCQKITELALVHNDPFDRLLVAQALCEEMTILTVDANIVRYPVPTLW
jgi:PIN domain nuclease of toxin-antitoxin system